MSDFFCHPGIEMRRLVTILAAVALVAVVAIGLSQAGTRTDGKAPGGRFDLAQARRELAGAPPALAGLYAQASELLGGGKNAFQRRLRSLRGHPVVLNKWASWCRPCRDEFPIFQQVSVRLGTTVAFLGLNSGDKRPAARAFLRRFPVPYPSYSDPAEEAARAVDAAKYYPMTVFIDRRGKVVQVHPGQYRTTSDLEDDVRRYLR